MRGRFTLVRIRSRGGEENQWLLMKSSDGLESEEDLTISRPESVLTGKTIEEFVFSKYVFRYLFDRVLRRQS